MHIAILLYDDFTALDAVGPYEVLGQMPGSRLDFVAKEARPYRADTGHLALVVDKTLSDVPTADVLVIPGGPGSWAASQDPDHVAWIQQIHATSKWTTSVCTGSELLAASGLLTDLPATTYWMSHDRLAQLGAKPVEQRWVRNDRVITAAGVSSGIDMAIQLVAWEFGDEMGQLMQLAIEYNPSPPFVFDDIPERVRDIIRSMPVT